MSVLCSPAPERHLYRDGSRPRRRSGQNSGGSALSRVIAFAVLLTCLSSSALASPLEDSTLGGAVFTGPVHPHATSIYLNPAALGLTTQGWHVYLGGSLRLDQFRIQRQRITDPREGPEPGPQVAALTAVPGGTIATYWKVGRRATIAVAMGLPMNEEFIADESDLGYHTLGGHHRQLALSLASAFQVNRRLYFGTGLSLTTTEMKLRFLRDTALEQGLAGTDAICGAQPCGIENPEAAEIFDVSVGSSSITGLWRNQKLALYAGVVYQVAQDWWLGLGYQSPAGLQGPLTLTGTADVTLAPRDTSGTDEYTAEAEMAYKLPQTFSLGVRGPIFSGYELIGGLRWQNWSRQQQLDIRMFGEEVMDNTPEWYPRYRGMRDVLLAEAGIEGIEGGPFRIGGRVRVERGATADQAISPLQVAGFNLSLVAGAEVRIVDGLTVTASYGFTWYPRVRVSDSLFDPLEQVDCVESNYDIDACAATAEGRALPSAEGSYLRLGHAARLSIRYTAFP